MIQTRMVKLDPKRLKLLDLNAHFMRQEVFARLVENLKTDGGLTGNAPFAWRLHDDASRQPVDDADGQPVYEVLSGNHRVKGAIAAGLVEIDVCITDDYLDPDRRRAIQLSHNAIFGEDDPATLRLIYESIESPGMRLYTGLDDKGMKLLEEVSAASISEAGLQFQPISLTFLPHEVEQVAAALEAARKIAKTKGYWLASMADYDRAMDALELAGQAYGVKNTATALMLVLEVFSRHLDELTDGYLDAAGEPQRKGQTVPLATVTGSLTVPAAIAAKLKKALHKLNQSNKLAALEALADSVLQG